METLGSASEGGAHWEWHPADLRTSEPPAPGVRPESLRGVGAQYRSGAKASFPRFEPLRYMYIFKASTKQVGQTLIH